MKTTPLMKIFLMALLIAPVAGIASNQAEMVGTYEGSVEFTSAQPKIILCLGCDQSGMLKGEISLPDQNQNNLPVSNIRVEGDNVYFELSNGRATACFKGIYSADQKTICGKLTQAGQEFPFELKYQDKERTMKLK